MRFSFTTLLPLLLCITPVFSNPTPEASPDASPEPQSAVVIPVDRRGGNDRFARYDRCVARAPDGPRRFPNSCYYDNEVRRDCAERNGIDRITVQDCRTGRFYTQVRGRNGRFARNDYRGGRDDRDRRDDDRRDDDRRYYDDRDVVLADDRNRRERVAIIDRTDDRYYDGDCLSRDHHGTDILVDAGNRDCDYDDDRHYRYGSSYALPGSSYVSPVTSSVRYDRPRYVDDRTVRDNRYVNDDGILIRNPRYDDATLVRNSRYVAADSTLVRNPRYIDDDSTLIRTPRYVDDDYYRGDSSLVDGRVVVREIPRVVEERRTIVREVPRVVDAAIAASATATVIPVSQSTGCAGNCPNDPRLYPVFVAPPQPVHMGMHGMNVGYD